MTDKLISDLGSIGAAIADNTATEVQRNGQTTTEQALGSDWKTYIKSWIAKADVGLGNVTNSLQLVAASNLSDVASAGTSRANLKAAASDFGNYVTGVAQYYQAAGLFGSGSFTPAGSASASSATMYFFPFAPRKDVSISELLVKTATGVASTNMQMAIYASDVNNKPTGAAIASSASASTSTSSSPVQNTLSASLTGGNLYWIAFITDNATVSFNALSTASVTAGAQTYLGSTSGNSILGAMIAATLTGQTFGTWPTLSNPTLGAIGSFLNWAFKVA